MPRREPGAPTPLPRIKLLLIEDSTHDVELTLLTLERYGLQVDPVVVHDHIGACEAMQQHTFDVIVCDYLLPSSSGIQVLEVAQRAAPETPFIFLSGIFGEQQAVETMRLGAVDYVLKPVSAARLFTAVLRGLVEHRFNGLVLEQALVHRRGDGHPVLFDRGSGGLDDGLGMFGSGAHQGSPIRY